MSNPPIAPLLLTAMNSNPNHCLRPKYLARAGRILEGIQTKRQKVLGKPKAEVFVGIHARRGDYVKFAQDVLGLKPLKADFYKWAINKRR